MKITIGKYEMEKALVKMIPKNLVDGMEIISIEYKYYGDGLEITLSPLPEATLEPVPLPVEIDKDIVSEFAKKEA